MAFEECSGISQQKLSSIKICPAKQTWCDRDEKKKKKSWHGGALGWLSWLSGQFLVLAQVMISLLVNWRPSSGSMLTVWSLLGILSPSSFCPSPAHALSLALKRKKKSWHEDSFFFFFLLLLFLLLY